MSLLEVTRVTHRRPNPGSEREYEELVKAMLDACSRAPGYISSIVIPPRFEDEDFHIVQKFRSQADLDLWQSSDEAAEWRRRLQSVSDRDPEHRLFETPDLWFSSPSAAAQMQPARWRMALVTWLGIFPTAALFAAFLMPALVHIPFLPRMLVFTGALVATMYYVVMPRLLVWMGWWLRPQ